MQGEMMKLIDVGLEIREREHKGQFPTVKDMLKYIKDNDIPMDAEIVVEHVDDIYLMKHHWSQYRIGDEDSVDGESIMLPIHNGFGSIENKKYFALWMHY